VIVTTYNSPDKLLKALNSLLIQNTTPSEIIVADDGSGDETRAAIEEFKGTSPCPVKHVWQEDTGFRAARSRNMALKESTGEYIIFLDGDCLVDRNFISDHLIISEPGYFVQGKRVIVNKGHEDEISIEDINGGFARLMSLSLSGKISNSHHTIRLPLWPAWRSTKLRGIKTCNFALYKEDAYKVNGFNEDFIGWGREDSEFAVRLFHSGLKRKGHPFMAICYHLWHAESTRESLPYNDKILNDAINSNDFRCANGLEKDV
jgi:glycosyltransferase involved in cell wall biosynthesis